MEKEKCANCGKALSTDKVEQSNWKLYCPECIEKDPTLLLPDLLNK